MCGLFGIINSKPANLDKRAFFTLGVNNDSRGGDACGVFIDGAVEYGVDKKKLFADFFEDSKLLKQTKKCSIALGHCRKASVGGIGADKAQPCTVSDENGNIIFVVTHNGTIRNYKDLAKKYIPDQDITGLSDSQVMTLIFFHAGYDVLNEYIGGGAFVIADYRGDKPKVLMFHGLSKISKYSSVSSEERPLYVIYDDQKLVYSSIPDFLRSLYYNHELKYITHNKLVEYVNGKLVVVAEYDRKDAYQQDYSSSSAANNYTFDDDDYDDYYYGRNRSAGFPQLQQGNKNSQGPRKFVTMDNNFHITDNLGKLVTNEIIVNANGDLFDSLEQDTRKLFVFNGVVLHNKDCYEFLCKVASTWKCTPSDFYKIMPYFVNYFSPFPMKDYAVTTTYFAYEIKEDLSTAEKFSGTVQKLFSNDIESYEDGIKNYNTVKTDRNEAFKFLEESSSFEIPRQVIIDYLNDLM